MLKAEPIYKVLKTRTNQKRKTYQKQYKGETYG